MVLPERAAGRGPTDALPPPVPTRWRARPGSEMQSESTTPVWSPLI